MPDNEIDPAGNTQQFRAFVQHGARDSAAKSGNAGLMIGVAVAVVIAVAVIGLAVTVL
ncbi:MAG TPA: hypothetical protein VFU43_10060 [Streptosporangiaceae bacterium]|nr:hypothetical protein [Streptosporangiaceae bacterium]